MSLAKPEKEQGEVSLAKPKKEQLSSEFPPSLLLQCSTWDLGGFSFVQGGRGLAAAFLLEDLEFRVERQARRRGETSAGGGVVGHLCGWALRFWGLVFGHVDNGALPFHEAGSLPSVAFRKDLKRTK